MSVNKISCTPVRTEKERASQVGQLLSALFSLDDSLQTRSTTLARGDADYTGELDGGIFQSFLNRACCTRMLPGQNGSGSRDITQVANDHGRYVAAAAGRNNARMAKITLACSSPKRKQLVRYSRSHPGSNSSEGSWHH